MRIGPVKPLSLQARLEWAAKLGILPPDPAKPPRPQQWYGIVPARLDTAAVLQAFGFANFGQAAALGKATRLDSKAEKRRRALEELWEAEGEVAAQPC